MAVPDRPNPLCLIQPAVCAARQGTGFGYKSVAGSAFQAVVDAFAKGLADVMKVLMTFWIHVPEPDLTSPGGVVSTLDGLTRPLVAFAAIVGLIVAGARLAMTAHHSESMQNVLRGLLMMVAVTAAGAVFWRCCCRRVTRSRSTCWMPGSTASRWATSWRRWARCPMWAAGCCSCWRFSG